MTFAASYDVKRSPASTIFAKAISGVLSVCKEDWSDRVKKATPDVGISVAVVKRRELVLSTLSIFESYL